MPRLLKLIVILLLVLIVLVLVVDVLGVKAAPVSTPSLLVAPGSVERYQTFLVTVIAPVNVTFKLDVYGADSFHLDLSNRTDHSGLWTAQLYAYYPYGQYDFLLLVGNDTERATLSVTCGAQCISSIIQGAQQDQGAALSAALISFGTFGLLAVVAFDGTRTIVFFRDRAKRAKETASFTDREVVGSGWARMRGWIQPGDQVVDPVNPQNPRIFEDQRRRMAIERLHDATDPRRFGAWNPAHVGVLEKLVGDVRSATNRLQEMAPQPEPIARAYETAPLPAAALEAGKPRENIPDGITNSWSADRERIHTAGELATSSIASSHNSVRNRPKTKADDMDTMKTWIDRQARVGRRERILAAGLVAVGLLLLAMAALVLLAYAGIRVEALSALWIAWPGDPAKILLGLAGGSALLGAAVLRLRGAKETRA